jgi:hypothetical protein
LTIWWLLEVAVAVAWECLKAAAVAVAVAVDF